MTNFSSFTVPKGRTGGFGRSFFGKYAPSRGSESESPIDDQSRQWQALGDCLLKGKPVPF